MALQTVRRRVSRPGGKTPRARRRVGIALGAGGARGLAHVGVLRALDEADVPIDAVVGTSIGSVVGAVYAAGQIENFDREARRLVRADALRFFDPVWPRSGLLSGERLVDWLRGIVGDWRIEDLAVPFGAVTVDLVSGEEILIREGPVIDALRASMSIPGIFVPPRTDGRVLVDGAIRNPVPVTDLEGFGVDVAIAVNLHGRPVRELASRDGRRRRRLRDSLPNRLSEMIESQLPRLRRRGARSAAEEGSEAPNLFEILTASMAVIEHELARHRLAHEAVDLVLTPDVHDIRSFEFHRARKAIHAGRVEVEARLEELRKILTRRRRRRRA